MKHRSAFDCFPTVNSSRFLLPAVGQPKPLCFDVPVPNKLKLLEDSASGYLYTIIYNACMSYHLLLFGFCIFTVSIYWFVEFSMNGESTDRHTGFRRIVLHYKTNHELVIDKRSIKYNDGQNNVEFLWKQEPTQHNAEG